MPGFEDFWFVRVARLRREADDLERESLLSKGWTRLPMAGHLWSGHVGGTQFALDQASAALFQEHADREAYFDKYPEEMED